MIKKIESLIKYLKIPFLYYFIALCVAILLGYIWLSPDIEYTNSKLSILAFKDFYKISINNCFVIFLLYVSIIFSKKIAYCIYIYNGLILGLFLGWILKYNVNLLWLIIPHGIFETPILLATGYIVEKGKKYFEKNTKHCICVFIIHEICTILCAVIEAYITPYFQRWI